MNRLFSSSRAVKMPFRKVSHVIFDMDGLILDTERLYTQVTQNLLNKYTDGAIYTYEVKSRLMGKHREEVAQIIVDYYKLPISYEEYVEESLTELITVMAQAELLPGAEKLIRHLHAKKIPIAVATSSGEDMVEVKTQNHKELFALFDHTVCGSTDPEVKKGKPAPDIFLIAASRFPDKPDPNTCLVFEDAPNGVQGAISAGMQCVMVPDVNCPEDQRKLANIVLNSLEDIKLEDFGLPPFE